MQAFFSGSCMNIEKIWFIIVVIVSFLPKILSSIYGVNDSFTYSAIAVGQVSADTGHIQFYPFVGLGDAQQQADFISERAAVTSFLVTIHAVTGLPIAQLRFVPVNAVVLIPLSYALARLLTRSRLAAGLYTVFLAYEPSINSLSYNVSYIGFGISLFFMFLLIYLKIFDSERFRRTGILILTLTFVAIYLTYYTAELDAIAFSFSAAVITLMASRYATARTNRLSLLSLTAVFVIIFVTFDSIFYAFLPAYAHPSIILDTITREWSYVKALLLLENSPTISVRQFEPSTTYIGLLLWLSVLLPTLVYLAYLLVSFVKVFRRSTATLIDTGQIVAFALLFVFVGDMLVYTAVGAFPFKDALLVFPLVSFLSISKIRIKKIKVNVRVLRAVLLCIIVLLAVAKFGAWFRDPMYSYATGAEGPVCMFSYVDQGNVLTDLRTGAVLLTNLAGIHRANSVNVYTFSYADSDLLYSQNQEKAEELFSAFGYNYLMLPYSSTTKTMSGVSWEIFRPLGTAFQAPQNYSVFNKICDDSRVVVYVYVG
jgi:hypothetical protein